SEKGLCKVICFSPDHSLTIPQMERSAIENVIRVWQDEYVKIGAMDGINYVQIFENKGAVMGCSNPHPHGQIWSNRSLPNEPAKEQEAQLEYYEKNRSSLLGDYLKQELASGERIVI
ncbi:MAG: galactose-1-phosphate uridylyltransferase, partial [Cryomorphaceae bacterium]